MAGTESTHAALWLASPGAEMRVGEAPVHVPGEGEIVVRARAIAVNLIDAMGGIARRVVLPWLNYPAVMGTDVAGEVVSIGAGVTTFAVGDRVVGHAVGGERGRNSATEGAFQTHVVLLSHMTAAIPASMPFEDACVLPLGVSTAAAGLFEPDQLGLPFPVAGAKPTGETVLVLGGATSVGMNAIQLAHNAGYAVVATASSVNAPLLQRLGASAVVDYHDRDAVEQCIRQLSGQHLAGVMAIASGSLRDAVAVTASPSITGTRRIASAHPTPVTRVRATLARRRQIRISAIWGGSPRDNAVGPAIWNDFLPGALARGDYLAAPTPVVVGHGLEALPQALDRFRAGAKAEKFIVTL